MRTLTETLPGDLPDAVRAAVRVGHRTLSPGAQRALAALALLEDRADADRVAAAAELPIADAHAALDELDWARWVTADPRGYAFLARIVRGRRRRHDDARAAAPHPRAGGLQSTELGSRSMITRTSRRRGIRRAV